MSQSICSIRHLCRPTVNQTTKFIKLNFRFIFKLLVLQGTYKRNLPAREKLGIIQLFCLNHSISNQLVYRAWWVLLRILKHFIKGQVLFRQQTCKKGFY